MHNDPNPYHSLEEIRVRKAQLRKALQKDSTEMRTMWNGMFKKEESTLPSRRMSSLMTTGAGVLDGLILMWKLYNKFKKPSSSISKKSKKSKKRSGIMGLFGKK